LYAHAESRTIQAVKASRREFLFAVGGSALAAGCGRRGAAGTDAGASTWPEKSPALILRTDRPPNLEMPLEYLRHDLTPNDLMFVRWHLAGLPRSVDLRTFRLTLGGHVQRPVSLSYDDLRALEPASIVAVNQCSGNSRALFVPRVPGVQWSNGALGNAKWTGVRLRTLLDRAGVRDGARCVTFRGLDQPPVEGPAPFVKSLEIDRARDPDVLVAWAMNDQPLPMLNGFPLRLVVPGWYSTYWVKSLTEVTVLDSAFDGYWMAKAYRVPATEGADEAPDRLANETVPISRLDVRSLVVSPEPGARLQVGKPCAMEGIAFDGGAGITRVEVSVDGGEGWEDASLDSDLGRYSFRRWRHAWTPTRSGPTAIVVRATSASGERQRPTPQWNRSGYMRNVYERTQVVVS
jgi:DMSO/TMAO reductase YedYZ molybdopterin-dependent catalytic subunit